MLDLSRLAGQGRAFNALRAWNPEELDALLVLERERGLLRPVAADFIRNGITTPDAYDVAVAAAFKPKTLVEVAEQAEASLKDNDFAIEVSVEPVVTDTPTEEVLSDVDVVDDVPAEKPAKKGKK